eukprot:7030452-Pyramimonas_sp.AAC.1
MSSAADPRAALAEARADCSRRPRSLSARRPRPLGPALPSVAEGRESAADDPRPMARAGRSGGQGAAVAAEEDSGDWAQEGRSGGHEEGQWLDGPSSGWDSWKGLDNGWWETRDWWIARQGAEREGELARGA